MILLISTLSLPAYAAELTVISENFNSYATDVNSVGGFDAGAVVKEFPSAVNKSISVSTTNTYNTFTSVNSGAVIVSYDYFITSKNNQKRLMQIFNSDKTKRSAIIYAEPDGTIRTHNAYANCYYPLNKWFNITLVLDIESKKYDLYMDRLLCVSDVDFYDSDAADISVIETVANSEQIYIDNVFIKPGYATKAEATTDATQMMNGIAYMEKDFNEYTGLKKAQEIIGLSTTNKGESILLAEDPVKDGLVLKFVASQPIDELWNSLNTTVKSGAMVISYDFYFSSDDIDARIMEVYGTYNVGNTRSMQVGVRNKRFVVNNAERADFPLAAGKWYNVSLLSDVDNNKTYVYIDGTVVEKNGFGLFNDADNKAEISTIKTLYNSKVEGQDFYVDNIYVESFDKLASAQSVLDFRLNHSKSSGILESYDIYNNNIAGYFREYRAINASAEVRNAALSNITDEKSKFESIYNLLWYDDYEKYDVGHEITSADGYMATTTAINPKVTKFANNKVVKLESQGDRARFLKYYDSAPTAYMVSFDFMQESISDISCLARTSNSNGNNMPFELYTANGSMKARTKNGDVTIMPEYKADVWYTINYYVDLVSREFYINIENETTCNSNYSFYSTFENDKVDLNRIFDTYTDKPGVYYIDNITVYENKLFNTVFPVELDTIIIGDVELPVPQSNFANYEWITEPDVEIEAGILKRPEKTLKSKITLKASVGSYCETRDFNVVFLSDVDMTTRIAQEKSNLYIPDNIYSPIISFPQSSNPEINIAWASENSEIIDENGNVTFPAKTDALVKLTATLTYKGADLEKVPAQTWDKYVNVKAVAECTISDVIYLDTNGSETRSISKAAKLGKVYVEKSVNDQAKLIVAAYTGNGALLNCTFVNVQSGWNELNWTIPNGTDNIKCFVFNNFEEIKPFGYASTTDDEDVKIWMLGDSMMATYDPSVTARVGWGSLLQSHFDSQKVTVRNEYAKPGYALKSAISSWYLNNVLDGIEQNDYVFISYGHNDSHDYDADIYLDPASGKGYQQYLTKYINAVRSRGAQPILLTSIERCNYDSDGKPENTLKVYSDSMKEIAATLGVPVIDLNTMTNTYLATAGYETAKDYYMIDAESDSTHLNAAGAKWVCDYVVEQLKALGVPVSKYVLTEN